MNLPGKLRHSTLGDLLGTLHRAELSGVLALRELQGITAGRCHKIHLWRGLVVAVETEGVLETQEFETKRQLEQLFHLSDAELSFHVARRGVVGEVPLAPADFLHGRPRGRDRSKQTRVPEGSLLRRRALALLGLSSTATLREIQRAFREQAFRLHPDRHPGATEARRSELTSALARLTQAYRILLERGEGLPQV